MATSEYPPRIHRCSSEVGGYAWKCWMEAGNIDDSGTIFGFPATFSLSQRRLITLVCGNRVWGWRYILSRYVGAWQVHQLVEEHI